MEKEVFTIRVPIELKEKLKKISEEKGLTINSIIVQAIWKIN